MSILTTLARVFRPGRLAVLGLLAALAIAAGSQLARPAAAAPVTPDQGPVPGGDIFQIPADCTPPLDVVFVIDDTGSMGGALAQVTASLTAILDDIETISGGNYQLGLFTFADTVQADVQLAPGNRVAIAAAMAGLVASGGGGTPEASDEALNTVINSLPARPGSDPFLGTWRASAEKVIILVTDAVPGGFDDTFTPGVDDVNAGLRAQEALNNQMIIGSVLVGGGGPPLTTIMQNYATVTGGIFLQGVNAGDAILTILRTLPTDLSVDKTGPRDVIAGEEAFYEIVVCNHGRADATNVQVMDILPQRMRFLAATMGGVFGVRLLGIDPVPTPSVLWTIPTLECGTCMRLGLKMRVNPDGRVQPEPPGPPSVTNPPVVTNSVTVTANNLDRNLNNNFDKVDSYIQDRADLRISKFIESTHDPIRAGEIFTYTIFVDNLGPSVARNVTVTDTFLSSNSVSIQSCAFSVSQGGGSISQFTCTTGNLVSTQFGTDVGTFMTDRLDPVGTVGTAAPPPVGGHQGRLRASFRMVLRGDGQVTNTARVTSLTPDPDMSNNFVTVDRRAIAVADLAVTKTATGEEQQTNQAGLMFNNAVFGQVFPTAPNYFASTRVTAGRRIQYRLTVTNNGVSPAENVVLHDRLPAGVRIYQGSLVATYAGPPTPGVPLPPAGVNCDTGTPGEVTDELRCGIGYLNRGQSYTLTFEVITDSGLTPGAVLENDAWVTSDTLDINNSNNMAFTQNTVLGAADLTLLKTNVGQVITGFNATTGQPIITDSATNVVAGLEVRYQVQVQNNGPSDTPNAVFQDRLPGLVAGQVPLQFLRAVGGNCQPDRENLLVITCNAGPLKAGERRTIDLYFKVNPVIPTGTNLQNCVDALTSPSNTVPPGSPPALAGGSFRDLIVAWDPLTTGSVGICSNITVLAVSDVGGPGNDPNSIEDNAIRKVDVPAEARLDKAVEPDDAIAGREHRYLITFGTAGPSLAQGVRVIDTLDKKQAGILGETFVRCEAVDAVTTVSCDQVGLPFDQVRLVTYSDPDGTAFSAGTGTLNPGKVYQFYLVTRVDAGYVLDADDFLARNSVNISTTTTDPNAANNTDTEDTRIIAEADLAITKVDDAAGFLTCDPVARGGTITYDLTVTNNGPSDAADVYVVDQLPWQFVVADPALVDVTVSRGQVIEVRDDGQITIRVGNDPNNNNVNELGRVNAGSAPVRIQITVTVRADAACGQQATNAARVETRQNDAPRGVGGGWPPAPNFAPGIGAGPRTPTADPVLLNNAVTERTTIECPAIQVIKTVSFDGKCPGVNITPGVFNQTAQPVTFCYEVTNTGTTFLDDIFLSDTLTRRTADPTEIYSTTITAGADPNMPVKPGETVRRQVTIPHVLSDWDCGTVVDTVTVTANPVNSGRTDLACLPDVTDDDTARINVPCAGVDWRLQLPILANDGCTAQVEVQNVGDAETKALMVVWGEPGACPPQAAGPLKIECTGLIAPGSSWHLRGDQMPMGANSAVLYSLSTNVVTDYLGQKLRFADLACLRLFNLVPGSHEWWLRFDTAYRTQDVFYGPIEDSGAQLKLDFKANQGEPLAAVVNRGCADAGDPNVTSWAAYTSVSSDQEGARDPVFGGFTYYTPLLFANKGGLNSLIHIHNSGDECSSIEIWLRTQDVCLRNLIADVLQLAPGETVTFDPNTALGPDWLGNAWISASQPLGIVVDTKGANHFTSYNGLPADVYSLGYSYGAPVNYAPLVYSEYQGWDSALQVQNLSATHAAKVKVYFLDRGGDIVTTLVDWICARGSQTYFLPVLANLPGSWVGSARAESQEWLTPGGPNVLAVPINTVVLLEKWSDPARTSRREAIAYNAQNECLLYDWQLGHGAGGTQSGSAVFAAPMVAKGNRGVTTELAITNLVPKPGFTDFAIYVYDQNHLIDYVCQKLNEKQVEYINLSTWGWLDSGFYGSAVVSAVFWEHDVFDARGRFERNLVGLGGVGIERVGGVLGGADVPGDESKGWEAFPIFDHYAAPVVPNCPGVPPGFGGR